MMVSYMLYILPCLLLITLNKLNTLTTTITSFLNTFLIVYPQYQQLINRISTYKYIPTVDFIIIVLYNSIA